jgi:rhodanese-related sulfurtransferase
MKKLFLGLALLASGCAERTVAPAVEMPPDGLLLDVRDSAAFAAGHKEGALNVQLQWGQLEKRAATYLPDKTRSIVLCMPPGNDEEADEARGILVGLGYEDVRVAPSEADATLPTMKAAELKARLAEPDPPIVIDVRSPAEWAQGVIAGALQIGHDETPSLIPGLDPARDYAVICAGGVRSSQMASLMRRAGLSATNVIDGMSAWYALDD